tara:strand:- start:764 stop:1012 length:249 start_codon:yes stop_codon:yes gene_type:complete
MTEQEIRDAVLESLSGVAPELDLSEVEDDTDLRNDLDLDSMDFLNFVIAVSERLGVDVPEADYGKMDTLAKCVEYLRAAQTE